jgi:tetratricopeptide (TPR) repeat protein
VAAFRRSIEKFESLVDSQDPSSIDDLAIEHNNLAGALGELGLQEMAFRDYAHALALWRKASELYPNSTNLRNNVAFGLMNVGESLEETGRLADALDAFNKAREILSALQIDDPSRTPGSVLKCLGRAGLILQNIGDHAQAVRVLGEQLAFAEKWAGQNTDNPLSTRYVGTARRDLGMALLAARRPADALGHFRRAYDIDAKPAESVPVSPRARAALASDLWRIGLAERDLGNLVEAAAMTRRAIGVYEALPSDDSQDLYEYACARAVLSGLTDHAGSGVSAAEGKSQANLATALLRRALAPGVRSLRLAKAEPALASLRTHTDFKALQTDLAMPAWPFPPTN